MGILYRFPFVFISAFLFVRAYAQAPILSLKLVQTGFNRPTDIKAANDNRLFVSEIGGKIKIIQNDTVLSFPFLDISAKVQDTAWAGIHSFAFHPNYAQNGRMYVLYVRKPDNAVQLSQFRRSLNPNQADTTEVRLLTVSHQLATGHRGGSLSFGPDGYLYISTGDDSDGGRGIAGDPLNNAQNLSKLFGKLLRIDVSSNNNTYAVPPDNPYQSPNDSIPDEIWARGLRNPWRISFDRATGDLWIGDNGQDGWEEVNFLTNNSPGGKNFGWRCYEGNHRYLLPACEDSASMVFPLHEYPGYTNNGGIGASVIGGYVYRGSQFSSLYGHYIYADYTTGKFWALRQNSTGSYQTFVQSITVDSPVTFGEDSAGELYVASFYGGAIYKLTAQACPPLVTLTAFDPIRGAALMQASLLIRAANPIISPASVTFSAPQSIELRPGFQVMPGSVFLAKPGPCLTNP
ncbi:MAG: PQQ-dependent sugar dehydrogenase [Spirosomataceae bacterium]